MGIRVCDEAGQKISFAKASTRFFAKWISSALFGIGFFMAAFTKKKQGLHDLMAGTIVTKQAP
jgi:uncharacterized RDD family membrane protein YckC